MTTSTTAIAQRPSPVAPVADGLVLALVVLALLGAWWLRQGTLLATERVTVGDLDLAIPANALPLSGDEALAVITPDGLVVRVEVLPAPPIGVEDPIALLSGRAVTQGQRREMYQAVSSDVLTVAGQSAGVLEYAYVTAGDGFFASTLDVIRGYDLLVGRGEQLYAVSIEGPDDQWADVEGLWPRLRDSLRFVGE